MHWCHYNVMDGIVMLVCLGAWYCSKWATITGHKLPPWSCSKVIVSCQLGLSRLTGRLIDCSLYPSLYGVAIPKSCTSITGFRSHLSSGQS